MLRDDVAAMLDALDAAGVPHMLVGAMALEAYGGSRATVDVDIQVAMEEVPQGSTWHGFAIEEHARDQVFGQETLILHRSTSPVPFEWFLTSHPFPRDALARRVMIHSVLLGRDVPVPTPEDLVVLKAAYLAHPSRSRRKAAQDALDLETLLAHAPLDIERMRADAERLGVWHVLEPLLE